VCCRSPARIEAVYMTKYKVILKVEIDADYLKKVNYVCVNYNDWDNLIYECVDFEILGVEEEEDINENPLNRAMRLFKKALEEFEEKEE
jgi:hypothetical protein